MKISKVNNIRKASTNDGFLFENTVYNKKDIGLLVIDRIEDANKNTKELYSIFRKTKKSKPWQVEFDNYIRNGYQKTYNAKKPKSEDELKKVLKSSFGSDAGVIMKIMNNSATDNDKKYIKDKIDKEIIGIIERRIPKEIAKSIKSQVVNFCIKDGTIKFIDTPTNRHWQQMLGINPKGDIYKH